MPRSERASRLQEDICIHIFTASAAMVGVCLTVIGIMRVVLRDSGGVTLADDLLAMDSVFFLASCLLAYWALRTRHIRRMHVVESVADGVFLFALFVMVVVCTLIVYEIV